jgi:hypothetical protein
MAQPEYDSEQNQRHYEQQREIKEIFELKPPGIPTQE